ncbi:protein still life, isoform SIF type 1 [Elysia marginata]|uniref:Protein still life, isoform SIF type 1 n=1 Tax=Elysia marginata TaxID=1093978 RepID=A0AAV4GQ82_9GAST|nr:protein still life, isoform SIF type 1 [Elysia marginata]
MSPIRLWADVFRVHGDGEYMRWERVSDDVVPVNISCIEDTPTTVFHVTAYNRQVEKIFDVCISQPGTIICPATECFVHWRDTAGRCEWGLNFATPTDAQRFRDCCSQISACNEHDTKFIPLGPTKEAEQRELPALVADFIASYPRWPSSRRREDTLGPKVFSRCQNTGYPKDIVVVDISVVMLLSSYLLAF